MVKSASEYLAEVEAVNLRISCGSVQEAKSAKREIISVEKKLRHVKQQINQDMKAIRAEYGERIDAVGQGVGNALLQLTLGKQAAGKSRAAEKRALRSERNGELEPYEAVKLAIDGVLTQTGYAKRQLDDYIAEAKGEGQ